MNYLNKVHVKKTSPQSLTDDVNELISSSFLPYCNRDQKTLIKINGNFDKIYPGSNTSPWFLDALLGCLRENGFRYLQVVEGDLLTFRAYDMIRRTGLINILHKHNVTFVDYEDFPRDAKEIPIIFEDSQIINTPVPHAHGLAKISCATKNLFGILPANRRKYHRVLSEKLLELNDSLKMLTIVDGTVGLDSESTRRGNPRKLGLLLSGWDNLKIDMIVSWMLGYDTPEEIPVLKMALEKAFVDEDIMLAGDYEDKMALPRFDFKFKHSNIRKGAIFLENTFLENLKSFVWVETQLHKIYHSYSHRKKKEQLFSGEWMEYYDKYKELIS